MRCGRGTLAMLQDHWPAACQRSAAQLEYKGMTHILRITDESSYGDKKATVHFLTIPNQEATFALQMLERFGLIAGRDNGEDSAS